MISSTEFREKYAANVSGERNDVAAQNIAHLGRILKLMPREARALEIGCYKGGTTAWLLNNGIRHVTVVDTFEGSPEHKTIGADQDLLIAFMKALAPYEDRYEIHQGRSDEILPMLVEHIEEPFDLIYIDASHDSKDVIIDATYAFKMLKRGGLMVFDDFEWSYYDESYRNPKPAILFFLACYANELEVIEQNYQLSVRKL